MVHAWRVDLPSIADAVTVRKASDGGPHQGQFGNFQKNRKKFLLTNAKIIVHYNELKTGVN